MKKTNYILSLILFGGAIFVASCNDDDDDKLGNATTATLGGESFTAFETDGTVSFGIVLNGPAATDLDLPVSFGGSATIGEDYTAPESSVHIAAGESTGSVELTMIADCVAEGDETIEVTLGSGGGLSLGGISKGTVDIPGNPHFYAQQFQGEFMADEPGYAVYPNYLEYTSDGNTLVTSNWWDSGLHINLKFNPHTNVVTIPYQEFVIGGVTYYTQSNGNGSYDPCTQEMVVPYIVRRKSNNALIDLNTHTYMRP
jgi:hypothetical protein